MVGWIILGVIAALIVVILCLRVSVTASFGDELHVTAQIGPVKLQVVPPPEKKPKKEKPKKEKAAETGKQPVKEKKKLNLHLTAADIRAALSAVWRAIQGALRRAGRRRRLPLLQSHGKPRLHRRGGYPGQLSAHGLLPLQDRGPGVSAPR